MSGVTSVGLEGPEVGAQTAEARLDFVRDADPAGRAHARVHVGQEPLRRHDLAAHARAGLGDEARETSSASRRDRRSPSPTRDANHEPRSA